MARLNIEQDIVQAYKVEYVDVASKQEVIGSLIGGWLPIFSYSLDLWVQCTPRLIWDPVKRREGTLETILSSPASRFDIVLGKF